MYLSTALFLASTAGLATAHPFQSSRRSVSSFPAGSSWDILLAKGDIDLTTLSSTSSESFNVIDIDLFDNDATIIGDLKSQKKQVICYFSAGSREDWRDDASNFTSSDYGKALDGWEGENYVDIKSENVKNIMKARIQTASDRKCDAIDPDNVDGFDQDGFGYPLSDYVDYVKFLANEAAILNMATGLKNAIDMIPDVIDVVQFAVNEQCHEGSDNDCAKYKPFTDANKAVFNIEYGGDKCDQPAGVKLSILIKPEDQALNTTGGACPGSGDATTPQSSGSAQASATKSATSLTASAVAVSSVKTTPTSSAVVTGAASSTVSAPSTPTPTGSSEDEDSDDDDEDDQDGEDDDDDEDDDEDEHPSSGHWGHGHGRPHNHKNSTSSAV